MPATRPNILLIFTDQQRADTIHALGNPVIRTPSLDRLCQDGVAFTNAFTPTPECVPARCSLKYGQYPASTRCYSNAFPMPEDARPSLMAALTAAGYRTHGIGKCHFTPDGNAMRGFQTRETQEEIQGPRADDYMKFIADNGFDEVMEPHGVRGEMYYIPQISQVPRRLHSTQWIGDRSEAFLKAQAGQRQPWFLFSSFIHPHPPFSPPSPWHKLYRAPLLPLPKLPPDWESLLIHINRVQNRYKYRDQGIDNNLLRNIKAHYYACISFIDYQVGRLLDTLAATGQLDNTLIIFTSDHGELLGDYNCFGKRSMHDSCARVPFILRQPGRFAGGRQLATPVSLIDVMPTALAAAGVTGSMGLDGIDLTPVAEGARSRDTVFIQYEHGPNAVYTAVSEQWKYTYSAPDNREFLFDRGGDPEETRNRAGAPFCDQALAMMRRQLQQFLAAKGESAALAGDHWQVYPTQAMPANPDAGLLIQDPPGFQVQLPPGYSLHL